MERLRALEDLEQTLANFFPVPPSPPGEEREPILWPSQEEIDARSPGTIPPARGPYPLVQGTASAASQEEEKGAQSDVQEIDPWFGIESNPWMQTSPAASQEEEEKGITSEPIEAIVTGM